MCRRSTCELIEMSRKTNTNLLRAIQTKIKSAQGMIQIGAENSSNREPQGNAHSSLSLSRYRHSTGKLCVFRALLMFGYPNEDILDRAAPRRRQSGAKEASAKETRVLHYRQDANRRTREGNPSKKTTETNGTAHMCFACGTHTPSRVDPPLCATEYRTKISRSKKEIPHSLTHRWVARGWLKLHRSS